MSLDCSLTDDVAGAVGSSFATSDVAAVAFSASLQDNNVAELKNPNAIIFKKVFFIIFSLLTTPWTKCSFLFKITFVGIKFLREQSRASVNIEFTSLQLV